jgi:hypothetical protein
MKDKKNWRMWNISTIWVARQQKMQDVREKLNPGLPWQKQHLTRRKLPSRTKGT